MTIAEGCHAKKAIVLALRWKDLPQHGHMLPSGAERAYLFLNVLHRVSPGLVGRQSHERDVP